MRTIKIPKSEPLRGFGIFEINGKTYVCPGWYEVPKGTRKEQIELIEPVNKPTPTPKRPQPATRTKRVEPKEWKVPSSNGKKTYIIKNTPTWTCTCPANQYRRGDCKHIKGIKKKLATQKTVTS